MPINSIPIFGVEPYNPRGVDPATDYGGGADVTQENLLISLWTNPSGASLDTPGELIKPASVTDAGTTGFGALLQPALSKQAFRSRLSTRFRYVGGNEDGSTQLLAILNPPLELKEAFLLNNPPSVDASSTLGLNTGLSLLSQDVWEWSIKESEGDEFAGEATFSGLPFVSSAVLFAKTNGADGVWPEFYPVTTAADYLTLLNALRGGAPFYIAVSIFGQFADGIVDIRWPFSGAARG